MNFRHSFTVLLLTVAATVSAQVQLSPIPQKATWGDIAISGNFYYTVTGEKTADQDAVRELRAFIADRSSRTSGAARVEIVIGKRGDAAVNKWKKAIPEKAEGYYLSVRKGQIVVAGADDNGTYYGVQTLRQILKSCVASAEQGGVSIPAVEIVDWPDVSERGVVEGFYGNPWSHIDRVRQFAFYGQNKMNTYIYGPKDDPYHRDHWRTPYPAESASRITELVEHAKANKVKFVWAVHPGVDIRWIKEDSLNIVNKLESVYGMGVRSFAVFFDDIGGEGAKAEKQAGLLNYITDEFVRKHSDVEPLIICPTEYNKSWSGKTYLPTLGKMLYPEVRVMWTGARVIDMIGEDDTEWIISMLGRKPYIWLNWPVNDYCVDHLLMGRTYGNDLTIAEQLAGFVSNPMEYAEASMLSLYSIADYTWNMKAYDKEQSWKNAIHALMPGHEAAFECFCDHNTDLGPNGHGMRRTEESAALAKAIKDGDTQAVCREVSRMNVAADELWSLEGHPLVNEILPWIVAMKSVAMRASLAIAAKQAVISDNRPVAEFAIAMQMRTTDEQMNILSRNFQGSIKSPNPRPASLVIEPYIKRTMRDTEVMYRSKWGNDKGLFRDPVIEDGQYYIKVVGKRLTDADANPAKVGDYPVLVDYNDTINPARQQWAIRLDAETDRYKITNVQDGRYVNENGAFWQTKGNPFDASWHTFILHRNESGFYSIQTAGSAGNGYLRMEGNRLLRTPEEQYIFEFVKVE